MGGGIWLKFELIQASMYILVICKNEDESIKMNELEWSEHFSHYKSMGIFQDAQGQLTLQSLVESGPNSNLSVILRLSSLPVSVKKIQSKMKALACSQHFTHYIPMGAIHCHGNQVPIRSGPKLITAFLPTQ